MSLAVACVKPLTQGRLDHRTTTVQVQKKVGAWCMEQSDGSSWAVRGLGCWMEAWLLFQAHLQHLCGITLQDYLLQSFTVEEHVTKRPRSLHLEVGIIARWEIHGVVVRNGSVVQMWNVKGLELLTDTECALAWTQTDQMLGWWDRIKEVKV